MIVKGKSVAARSRSCSKPSHTGLTTRLRPIPAIEKCLNRGPIVARTYDWSQRSWVIARDKSVATRSIDGHVQNCSCHITTGGTTNLFLTAIIQCGDVSVAEFHD